MAIHHEVTLLSFVDRDAAIVAEQLAALCSAVITVESPERSSLARVVQIGQSSQPDMAQRLYSEAMVSTLGHTLRAASYDIVQIEGLELAYLIPTAGLYV